MELREGALSLQIDGVMCQTAQPRAAIDRPSVWEARNIQETTGHGAATFSSQGASRCDEHLKSTSKRDQPQFIVD